MDIKSLGKKIKAFFLLPSTKDFLIETIKTIAMLVVSLLLSIVILSIVSKTPAKSIKYFLIEPFANSYNVSRILTESIPLMFTGVAVCIMAKAGQFNMFVEGGFFVGAFVAAVLAPELAGGSVLLAPLFCILCGAFVAAVLGYIPAKLKAKLGVDEFVSSLMLNYIVLWLVLYLLNSLLGDPDVSNATKYLESNAKLPFINEDNQLSTGIIFAVLTAILGWIFLFRTKWGYSIRMTGDNKSFAKYCGINVEHTIVSSQVIGAGLAGFGGGVYLLGNYYRFSWRTLPNYGFDGFVIAIIAKNNPIGVPLAALFLAYLRVGAQQMALNTDVQNEVIYIIQGLIIILFGAKFLLEKGLPKRVGVKEAK